MEVLMLVDTYSSSLSLPSFSSNTLNSINRSTTVVSNYNGVANRVNKSVENFIDHTESMRVFFKSFLNNQSDFLAFFYAYVSLVLFNHMILDLIVKIILFHLRYLKILKIVFGGIKTLF